MRIRKVVQYLIGGCLIAMSSSVLAGSYYVAPTAQYISLSRNKAGFHGLIPYLAVGYSELISTYVCLSGEIFGGPSTIVLDNNSTSTINLKTSYYYGISILPAYILDNVFSLFVRIGGVGTHFSSFNTTKYGFIYGVGAEADLDHRWSLVGELDRTNYSSINGVGSLQANQMALGLKYSFM